MENKSEQGFDKLIETSTGQYWSKEQFEIEMQDCVEAMNVLGEFIKEHNITSVVILDRSARTLGFMIREFLIKKEGFSFETFFLDHDRLIPKDVAHALKVSQVDDRVKKLLSKKVLEKEFEEKHPHLSMKKHDAILVLDEYVLNGTASSSVKEAMRKAGFKNLFSGGLFGHEGDGLKKADIVGKVRNRAPFFYNSSFSGVEHDTLPNLLSKVTRDVRLKKGMREMRERIREVIVGEK